MLFPGERGNNLNCGACRRLLTVAFSWIDLSTGEAGATTSSSRRVAALLWRGSPHPRSWWHAGLRALQRWRSQVRNSGVPFSDLPEADVRIDDPGSVLGQAYGGEWRDRLRGFSVLGTSRHWRRCLTT